MSRAERRKRKTQTQRRYRKRNRVAINHSQKLDRERNHEKYQGYWRKARYDITPEEYSALFAKQNGLCAVCARPEKQKRLGKLRALCVDHSHETGKIRGLLCCACNQGLGKFEDNPVWLAQAVKYLSKIC